MRIDQRLRDIAAAVIIGLIPIALFLFVYESQIPPAVEGEVDSRLYPDVLAYIWIGISAIHVAQAFLQPKANWLEVDFSALRHVALMFLIMGAGFLILIGVGYLAAGFFFIAAYTWILNERGPAAWIVAVAAPIVVYVFLEFVLRVRLPTVIEFLR